MIQSFRIQKHFQNTMMSSYTLILYLCTDLMLQASEED